MGRYKTYSYEQGIMIPVDFTKQIIPGTIEYSIHWLVDYKIDLSGISAKYKNNKTGAPCGHLGFATFSPPLLSGSIGIAPPATQEPVLPKIYH